MAVSIEVSTKTYNALASLVQGFETPESVIQRLLAAYLGEPDSEKPMHEGRLTPHKKRSKINSKQIARIYELTREDFVKNNSVSRDSIIRIGGIVAKEESMKESSAVMYATAVSKLLTGNLYGPSTNETATEYFIESIFSDLGRNALEKALSSLQQYIEHNAKKRNAKRSGLRKIHNRISDKYGIPRVEWQS